MPSWWTSACLALTVAMSCRRFGRRAFGAPVIFVTARDSLPDRLSGFAAGGDDYLTKPFAFAELVVRLRALIRRGGSEFAVDAGGLRLDPGSHDAACGGRTVGLTPTEFRILARGSRVARRRRCVGVS